jgi:sortase A
MLAKAELSQYLIRSAWQKTLKDKKQHKPWSWADTYPIFEMKIPRLNQSNYILAGSSGRNLAFSVTHMSQSGLLGENKTMVLSGHRDSHFSYLENLKVGDKIIIQDTDNTIIYKMTKARVIDSSKHEISILNKNELLLTSCYPFDTLSAGGNLRYVVYASPVLLF